MRVAALYDIHGNLPALEAVLAELERESASTQIVVGGDVLWGPQPVRVRGAPPRGRERVRLRGTASVTSCTPTVTPTTGAVSSSTSEGCAPSRCVAADDRARDRRSRAGCCSATRRRVDDEIDLTPLTPDAAVAEAFAGVDAAVVVCGHTHAQFDRARARSASRLVNAGSVGLPYEGSPGAFWALSRRPDVELRRTTYDVERALARLAKPGFPTFEEIVRRLARGRGDGERGDERVLREPAWRVASSPRHAVAGSERGGERIGPIVERLAEEHSDAEIALHFGSDVELLISVMLSAQTTDVNVNRVTEKLFVKYRQPEDYLAVPPEELEQDIYQTGFFRQKAKSIRGAMRMLLDEFDGVVPRTARRAPAAPRSRTQDGERRRGGARRGAGDRRRHPRAPDLPAARADPGGAIRSRSSATSSRSSRAPTGTGSRIC